MRPHKKRFIAGLALGLVEGYSLRSVPDTFPPDSYVFHPNHGHCKVVGKREDVLLRVPTEFLELKTLDKDPVTFRVPLTETARIARLRVLETAQSIKEKLELLKEPAQALADQEEERFKNHKEILAKGAFADLVTLFRDLYKLQKANTFATQDRKTMELSKNYILHEIMLVLNLNRLEARKLVEEPLKVTQKPKPKSK